MSGARLIESLLTSPCTWPSHILPRRLIFRGFRLFQEALHINTTTIEVDGILYPSVSYREDPNAIDVTLNLQHAESLQPNDWTDSKTELVHIETSVDSDGILRHSYRLITPIQDEIHHFFRLRVEY